jgi:pimeloyl-ACP methyl ester carboxylesterase
MKKVIMWLIALGALSGAVLHAQKGPPNEAPKTADTSPHTVQFVTVEKDVTLEVLDWGGTGRPLVLLAGIGDTAHVFDAFAPKLVPSYHVYGITRRGFGASSAPKPDCENYSADRLGDDILAVIGALKLNRPILVGHSIAGEELSSIGSRDPEKVAGLVYLEAGYAYAYYDDHAAQGVWMFDSSILRRELEQFSSPAPPRERKIQTKHLLEISLPRFERDLQEYQKQLQAVPDNAPGPPDTPRVRSNVALLKGIRIYTGVKCPVLAIFANPHALGAQAGADPTQRAAMIADDLARTSEQTDAFQAGNPSAHVVRLPNAEHLMFRSNEADVLREMNAFIAKLP